MVSRCNQQFVRVVPGRQHQQQQDRDHSGAQQSDSGGEESADNHTNGVVDQVETSRQHSSDAETTPDEDAYYTAMDDGRPDWAEVELKLGREKLNDQSSTNEVHSYHIDLSAYYASSQTVSTANTFTTITSVCLVLMCCIAHQH